MKIWLMGLAGIVLSLPGLTIAGEPPVNESKFDVRDGLLATSDGRPGSILAPSIEATEDDLSDVATRKLDVIYGRKFGTALTMDVYRPKRKANGVGIIRIISAGLWSGPEYRRMRAATRRIRPLLENGYTVFVVLHGCQPKFNLLDISHDVPRSVRYIRHHAKSFGIKPDRIGIMGFSSGGHLALLAATADDEKPHTDDPVDAESSKVQAVVAYYPNTDLLNYGAAGKLMSDHFREKGLKMDAAYDFHKWDKNRCVFRPMSEQECRVVFRAMSPLVHVSQDDPPTLLFHGAQDRLVPIQQSRVFERRMKKMGSQCELVKYEREGHAWKEPLPGESEKVIKWFDCYLAHRTR